MSSEVEVMASDIAAAPNDKSGTVLAVAVVATDSQRGHVKAEMGMGVNLA